jgi:hypothetical protein
MVQFSAVDVNTLGVSIPTKPEIKKASFFASEDIGLEVNAKKMKYTSISREENAEKYHDMKKGNKSFEFQTFWYSPNKGKYHIHRN